MWITSGNTGNGTSATVEASLKFLRAELLYDIRQYAYVEGDVTLDADAEAHHHRHQTQDVGERGNVDLATRRMDTAFEECVMFLQPIARVDLEDGESMDDKLVVRKEYNITLNVPEGFSRTTLGLLSKKIHDYIVFRVLALWLSVTDPQAAAKYQAMADDDAEDIKDARFQGYGAIKRPLYPF